MKDPNELEREKAAIIIQSWYRGLLVRRLHKEFFRKMKYRKFIIREIISFEKQYMDKINSILLYVKLPLITDIDKYKKFLTVEKVNILFSNLDEILQLHHEIFDMLTSSTPVRIGKIYLEMLPKFNIYLDYVKNYNSAFKIYAKLENYIDFSSFMEGLYLPSYLISPIQHTPRYVLLFSDLLKNTNPQNEDYQNLQSLLDLARKTASQINQTITASPQDQSEEEDDDIEIEEEEIEIPNGTKKGSTINSSKGNNHHNNSNNRHLSPNTSNNSPFKRPSSASSKRKPTNSIIMHKNAIDKVLNDLASGKPTPYMLQDFSNLPSYLRPTQASLALSKNKVEASPSMKMRISTNSQDKIDQHYVMTHLAPSLTPASQLFIDRSAPKNKPEWNSSTKTPVKDNQDYTKITKKIIRPTSPLPKPNFYSPTLQSTKSNSIPSLHDLTSSSNISSSKPPMFNSNNNNGAYKISSTPKSLSSNSLLNIPNDSSSSSNNNGNETKSLSVVVSST